MSDLFSILKLYTQIVVDEGYSKQDFDDVIKEQKNENTPYESWKKQAENIKKPIEN